MRSENKQKFTNFGYLLSMAVIHSMFQLDSRAKLELRPWLESRDPVAVFIYFSSGRHSSPQVKFNANITALPPVRARNNGKNYYWPYILRRKHQHSQECAGQRKLPVSLSLQYPALICDINTKNAGSYFDWWNGNVFPSLHLKITTSSRFDMPARSLCL